MMDFLTNPGITLLLLALGFSIVGWVKGRRWRDEYRQFQAWRTAGMPQASEIALQAPLIIPTTDVWDATLLPGAGAALQNPPRDLQTALTYIRHHYPNDVYQFPLGWVCSEANEPAAVVSSFVSDVNHILLTGQSDSGKDNVALNIMTSLAMQYPPEKVQFAIIDGKGLDWAGWREKAHTWQLALKPEDIGATMESLSAERRRRLDILQAAEVAKWDEYTGGDLPLLVVYVSELLLLQNATSRTELTSWLNAELTAARAFGIRYIIACQTASNFDTQWRSQISLFLAGFQPAQSQDQPNTNITTRELEDLGAIPPSRLPNPPIGAGVFTAVQGRDVCTVRASYLSSQHRKWLLSRLPNREKALHNAPQSPRQQTVVAAAPQTMEALLEALHAGRPLPLEPEALRSTALGHSNGVEALRSTTEARPHFTLVPHQGEALPIAPDVVPFEEQTQIIEAAKRLTSRRKVCQEIFGSAGGAGYEKVRVVLDAAGLLVA